MNLLNHNVYQGIQPSGTKSIAGWNSYSPFFCEIIEKQRPQTIIEVGTWLGASAIHMAGICKSLGLSTKIYCVDTWLGAEEFWTRMAGTEERDLKLKNGYPSVYFDFLGNVVEHGFQDVIVPVPNTSFIGSVILQHYGIKGDLIYIDGSHLYEDVKADIVAYRPLLTNGGTMFGDEIGWESVSRAVSEVAGGHQTIGPFWVAL